MLTPVSKITYWNKIRMSISNSIMEINLEVPLWPWSHITANMLTPRPRICSRYPKRPLRNIRRQTNRGREMYFEDQPQKPWILRLTATYCYLLSWFGEQQLLFFRERVWTATVWTCKCYCISGFISYWETYCCNVTATGWETNKKDRDRQTLYVTFTSAAMIISGKLEGFGFVEGVWFWFWKSILDVS